MFKKLFRNFAKSSLNEIEHNPRRRGIISNSAITFVIHQGYGGTVIETEYYDFKNDQTERNLYVIPDGQDLGAEISRILMVEHLKK